MRRLFSSVAAVVLVAACSGGDGPTPPTGTPGITLAASASSGTVALGASSTTTLTLTRVDGYSGAVALTAEGAPTGVTVSFAPQSLTGTTLASTATISVALNATAGPASLTFRATGTGVTAKTVVYALTIPTPGITVSAGTATVTAAQGTTVTAPITITRTNGATAAVTLTAEGLPSNVTASFSPNPIPSGSTTSTLTLVVGPGANVALSTITVRAAATGLTDQTATFPLSITSAAVPAYTLSPTPAAVSIVAGQSGQSILTIAKSGGFAGNVALALEGAPIPTGLTGTFAPNPATGTTATLTLNTTLATAPGTYNLTVRGTTAGLTDRTTTVSVTVTAVAGITVTLAPPALSIAQGATAQTAITLARLGGLTGDLQMTATGMPTGLTVGFAPTTVTGSASTLTVTVGAAVPAAVYPIVVTATGAGAVVGTATLTVTVTIPSGFTLSATGVSIAQGALGTSTVTVTRIGGFANNVDLIASNVPANVAVAFAPASVAGTTSTLTFTVGAAAVPGAYTVMINGTGTGAANQSTTVALTITTASGGTVGFRFCDAARVPLWLAFRNGTSGAWTRVTPSADNTFSFNLTGNTGAVAFVQNQNGGGTQGTVYLSTAAELTSIGTNECVTNAGVVTKMVNGTISGLSAMQTGYVLMGGGNGNVTGPATAFQANGVANRMTDLLAFRTTTVIAPASILADRGALRRNVNYAAGSTAPDLSFTGAESFPLSTATVTLANFGADNASLLTTFSTSNGEVGSLILPQVSAGSGTLGVPSTHTVPGDFHRFIATASTGDFLSFRSVFQFNRDLANRTLTFGAPLNLPTLTTVATAPYARLKVVGTWQAEYGEAAGTLMSQSSRSWTITGSRGYFGAASAQFDLELPDFTGTAGFLNVWGLTAGTVTQVTTTVYGAIVGTVLVVAEGNSFKTASRVQTITP